MHQIVCIIQIANIQLFQDMQIIISVSLELEIDEGLKVGGDELMEQDDGGYDCERQAP